MEKKDKQQEIFEELLIVQEKIVQSLMEMQDTIVRLDNSIQEMEEEQKELKAELKKLTSEQNILLEKKIKKNPDEVINQVLQDLGISTAASGYILLEDAIKLCLKKGDLMNSLSKELYPQIASKHNISIRSVEGRIARTIQSAYRKNPNMGEAIGVKWDKYPLNSEFISLVLVKIKFKL